LDKYQNYYRVSDKKEELFKLRQKEDESLEDFLDRFIFLVKRCGEETMSPKRSLRPYSSKVLMRTLKEA